eukprot:15365638-Ditylum_brightwellii.AAC.1
MESSLLANPHVLVDEASSSLKKICCIAFAKNRVAWTKWCTTLKQMKYDLKDAMKYFSSHFYQTE